MPLTKLQFQPGINKETTSYSNEGGWFDCDKVRFRQGFPEKIGGWSKLGSNSFLGSCRALHPWRTLQLDLFLGVGTSSKYYIEWGQGYYDITPLRETTAPGAATLAKIANDDPTITVQDTNHGAIAGDFVTFSGAISLGGSITAAIINQEYQIFSVTDVNNYTIKAREVASVSAITVNGVYTPTTIDAVAGDTGNGGGSIVAAYQVSSGLNSAVFGTGWGTGTWSRGTWGSAATLTLTDLMRIWTHDNFGEDLVINIQDGDIFFWDASAVSALSTRAVSLATRATALGFTGAPTIATKIIVSDVDRHILAFGADPVSDIGTQDPLLIRFSDQQNAFDWTPTINNSAGELRLGSGSKIETAVETRQQILVFTDVSLYAMQFVGAPFTFGISMISENTTIRGPLAVVAVDDAVYWMGKNEFYVYNGGVQKLPCTVRDYVFSNFNEGQAEKCFAALNSAFSEVWWYYPSANSSEIDRYVVFNYVQNIWYVGNLNRTAWIDRGVYNRPIAASTDYYLYNHETGSDDGSTSPSSPISAYIESSQFDIGEGDQFSFVNRVIPDLTFRDSTATAPSVNMVLKSRNYPGGNFTNTDSSAVTRSATVPVEQFTQEANVRLRGRSMTLKVDSTATGVAWRLGSPRIDVRPDGRR
tara:strand:- start:480 stop:2411 length:1932 start_codon:yes stop_codon:yes gene_type:complete